MFKLQKQGAVKVISGDQPLNAESALSLKRVADDALSQGQPRLVLDLQGIALFDSVGLEALLDLRDRCATRGGALQLAAPSRLCRDILAATGILQQFAIFDDTLSAVGSFAQ